VQKASQMNLNDMQSAVVRVMEQYCSQYSITLDDHFAQLKLYEEIGEFTQAVLIHKQLCRTDKHQSATDSQAALAEELADILGMVLVNAHLWDIDLQQAIKNKWMAKLKP
jgi:NTP pyrophosphatase (non-canonical NTP hydrolase)